MLHPFTHLSIGTFAALLGKSYAAAASMVADGRVVPFTPPPRQRPDGLWQEPGLIALDAVIAVVADRLAGQRGASREAVTGAQRLLQMAIVGEVGRDADTWIGLVEIERKGKRGYQVMAGTPAEIKADASFLALPGTSRAWFASIRKAVETVRQRAKQHGIELPERFVLTGDEALAELHERAEEARV